MEIRRANENDINSLLVLLNEVLEIHAAIRPDIFVSGSTKYSKEELLEMIKDDGNPIFVAVNDDELLGYLFCEIISPKFTRTMVPNKILYIDDLCVSKEYRNQKIGKALFDYAKQEAKKLGCYEICLYLWEGNDNAKAFYEKMGMKVKAKTMEYIIK